MDRGSVAELAGMVAEVSSAERVPGGVPGIRAPSGVAVSSTAGRGGCPGRRRRVCHARVVRCEPCTAGIARTMVIASFRRVSNFGGGSFTSSGGRTRARHGGVDSCCCRGAPRPVRIELCGRGGLPGEGGSPPRGRDGAGGAVAVLAPLLPDQTGGPTSAWWGSKQERPTGVAAVCH